MTTDPRSWATQGWLAAVLDPSQYLGSDTLDANRSLAAALSLLVDARFVTYQTRAASAGWPPFGSWPGSQAEPEAKLVAAFGLQLAGSDSAVRSLVALANDEAAPFDVRAVAAVLASLALRDAGRADVAADLLSPLGGADPAYRAWQLIHRSLALRELGDAVAACDSSLSAESTLEGDRLGEIGRALLVTAQRNTAAFAFLARRTDLIDARIGPYRSWVLDRIESRAATGMASFIDQEFEGRIQDPSQMTMRFRQEDPVETPLRGALLRAEVVGDWHHVKEARGRLARYQLLASVGIKDRKPVPALFLLRRSGEVKELRRAIRWYDHEGPLPPIREFGTAVATDAWTDVTVQADLVALAETADLLEPMVAGAALVRIIEQLDQLMSGTTTARLESDVFKAIQGLVVVAEDLHGQVAARLRTVLSSTDDVAIVQSALPALEAIDWTEVDEGERSWWYEYCARNLTGATDHRFTSAALIRALPPDDRLRSAAQEAFSRQPDLLTAANALVAGPPSRRAVTEIAQIARQQLTAIREQAASGSHGFGAFISAPALLAQLLLDEPGMNGWRDLLSFVFDRNVAPSQKLRPMQILWSRHEDLPPSAKRRIANWVRRPIRHVQLPLQDMDAFRAAILLLRFQYRAKAPDALLADLMVLAADESTTARHQAARLLPHSLGSASLETVLTLGLTLSRDGRSEVRGAAAASLAQMATSSDGALVGLAWDRVVDTMHDPGAVAPMWTLGGLERSDTSRWPPTIRAVVAELARGHASRRVRSTAQRLLETGIRGDGPTDAQVSSD